MVKKRKKQIRIKEPNTVCPECGCALHEARIVRDDMHIYSEATCEGCGYTEST